MATSLASLSSQPAYPRLLRFWLSTSTRGFVTRDMVRVEYLADGRIEQALAVLREPDWQHEHRPWLADDYGSVPDWIAGDVAELALARATDDERFAGWDDNESAAIAALEAA